MPIALPLILAAALAAQAAGTDDCQSLLAREDMKAEEAVAAAVKCVGWLDHPGDNATARSVAALPRSTRLPTSATRGGAGVSLDALPAGALANEFLSLIAEIAVDRARRQGLSFIKDRIEQGVCGLKFADDETARVLPATCTLVANTDLQILVGEGHSLRAALSSDVIDLVARKVPTRGSPVERSAGAALALLKRFAADPDARLTKNDVWLVVDAFLNEPWDALTTPVDIEALQYGIAAARVYAQALQTTVPDDRGKVDLAAIIRLVKNAHNNTRPTTPNILEYANLASKAIVAAKTDGSDDYVARLRSALTLILQALTTLTRDGVPLAPAWVRPAITAVLDADAPHLTAAIADAASDALIRNCNAKQDCRDVRTFSALLTGIATYALTYDNKIPDDATAEQRLAFRKDQREARKEALESVIDAATDRRGREGTAVWSLGVGVGGTLFTRQQVDVSSTANGAAAPGEPLGFQLHVPLGISYQWLPTSNWFHPIPIHLALTVLDLGNYVGKTTGPNSSPDWRAIIAPGFQVAVAVPGLSRATNLVLVGYSWTYAPQFFDASTSTSAAFTGAHRRGLFVTYYVPLWDFN